MYQKITAFFFGEVCIHLLVSREQAVNILLDTGIPCYNEKKTEKGLMVCLEKKHCRKLIAHLKFMGYAYEILKERGLFPFLFRITKRPGLVMGLFLASFLLYQSSVHLWDVEITGNEKLSDKEVLNALEPYGFYIGCPFKKLDFHYICNDLPIGHKDIAWISVNMMGTVAEIQVVELEKKEPSKPPVDQNRLVNLVAKEEGEILRYELSSGSPLPNVGSVVEKDQLLVRGYSESDTGLFPQKASGRVLARVHRFEEAYLPYKERVSIKKEEVTVKKTLNILGKEIIFYKNSRFLGEKYDTIDDEYRPTVFKIALPFRITEEKALLYEEKEKVLNKGEAEDRLRELLTNEIHKEELLLEYYEFFFYEEQNGLRAVCHFMGICDIAKPVEIEIQSEVKGALWQKEL